MGESFVNYGRDGRSSETHPRFSVPPPNIPMQPNLNKNIRQWDNSAGDAPPMWNTGGYTDNYGGGNDNHANMNFRRENNRGMGNGGGNKDGYNKGYGGGGGSGGGSSSGSNEMIIQEDTIFVSGMDPSITEQDINNHFGSIGIIKKDKKTMKPKIWLYKHKDTGLSKGEATVTYDDINAAKSAISWFDGRDFNGSTVKVSLAQRQNTWNKSGNKGNFGGPRGGGSAGNNAERGFFRDFERNSGLARDDRPNTARSNSGGPQGSNNRAVQGNLSQREGDWKCAECNNTNFAWRNECNRCKAPKKENSSFDGSASKGSGNKPPNFVDTRRNFRNNRGGGSGGGGGGGGMHLNYAQRDESDRNNSTPGSGFSGNRRDGGPVRNMTSDRGGRMRPY